MVPTAAPTPELLYVIAGSLLRARQSSYRYQPPSDARVFSAFEASVLREFAAQPTDQQVEPVGPHGLPFVHALLAHEPPVPVSWIEAWATWFGPHSVVWEAPHGPAWAWIEQTAIQPFETGKEVPTDVLQVATWLARNLTFGTAPARISRWVNAIAGREAAHAGALTEALRSHLLPEQAPDPQRCAERWLPASDNASVPTDRLVRCVSGRVRPLSYLLAYRNPSTAHDPLDPALPALPHQRRDELIQHWILDPTVSTDVARSRLWAGLRAKPEIWEALQGRKRHLLKRNDAEAVARIDAVLAARDSKGRSLCGSLQVYSRSDARSLGNDLMGDDPSIAWDTEGRGLMAQVLAGSPDGPWGRHSRLPRPRLSQPLGKSEANAWLGDPKHIGEWVDHVLDRSFPGNFSGMALLEVGISLLEEGNERDRLVQALMLSNVLYGIRTLRATKVGDGNYTRNIHYVSQAGLTLIEHLRDTPLCLDVGCEEWQQWRLHGLTALLHERQQDHPIQTLEDLDKLVQQRASEWDMQRQLTNDSLTPSRRKARL